MSFIDFPWRFANVPQPEVRTRIWQNVANGGAAAFNVHGTLADQQDRSAINVAIPAYGWLKDHQEYFVGQRSEARVFLLAPRSGGVGFQIAQDSYRGLFRLLTEQHIPFAAVENLGWAGKRDADLVITPGPAPKALEAFVESGGRLIIAGPTAPEFDIAPTVKLWKDPDGAYFRIRDKAIAQRHGRRLHVWQLPAGESRRRQSHYFHPALHVRPTGVGPYRLERYG
jgi:hypothetical protein